MSDKMCRPNAMKAHMPCSGWDNVVSLFRCPHSCHSSGTGLLGIAFQNLSVTKLHHFPEGKTTSGRLTTILQDSLDHGLTPVLLNPEANPDTNKALWPATFYF